MRLRNLVTTVLTGYGDNKIAVIKAVAPSALLGHGGIVVGAIKSIAEGITIADEYGHMFRYLC
jgi:hypothetical protein